ncbi:leucine-rich repeat-containing protein 4-like isoform X1 [Lytechinus variegatus]|uniref:leucine-rich repeat-containing protein 4-like isoform X1 n=1 Tax=Lytechinus variegatus TaxID=7654 RepID=UPI001BB20ECD|nr:leucine-rich repeat-containing protein 4-like isoform X1 [Lytechinus variegatus]
MARGIFVVTFLLVIFHLVFAQECPSGTPDGCQCQNRIFNCSGLNLNTIPAVSLQNFDVFDFSYNSLQEITSNTFTNVPLQRIILKNNLITMIQPGAFDDLNQLTSINFEQNSLSTLDQTGFNLVSGLTELLLNGNPFDCSNAANAWLKGWLASSSDSPVLTGECSGTPGTIFEAIDALAEPASALFSFEQLDYRVAEDAGVAEVVVTRTGIVGTIVQFDVTVTSGTALEGQDFAPTAGSTHTMLEGQTRVGIDILLIDDPIIETDESFTVSITIESRGEANMGTVVDGTTRVTIQDNDSPVPTMVSTTASTIPSPTASTQAQDETTNPVAMMTTAGQSPQPTTNAVNVAAIVVPIILITVIVAVIAGYLWYRQTRTINKATTAGVRYAAVQNRGKVYSDVTAKA